MRRLPARHPLGRLSRAALLLLVVSWACGGSSESKSTTTAPPPPPPAPKAVRVVIVTSPATTAAVKSAGGEFAVRVENAAGAGVPGVRVDFGSQIGSPGWAFTPADTMTTDSTGVARVGVTFGSRAGPDRLVASADGVVDPAMIDVTITPGSPAFMTITPNTARLFGAGDSAMFQAWVTDSFQNTIKDAPLDLKVSDSTLLSITPPTTFLGKGMVRSLRAGGSAVISSATVTSTTPLGVTVLPNPRNVCTGVATPQDFSFGNPITVTDSVVCLAASSNTIEYSLAVFNESSDGGTSLGTTVTGTNVGLDRLSLTRIGSRPSFSRVPTLARSSSGPKLDLSFHERLLTRSRSLRRLFGPARAARSMAGVGATGRIRGPSYARIGSAPPVPAVDDLVALNVASDACTTADVRTFRVEAVGDKAIVLADTANPTGGFTRTDYQRFATRFDTLVYVLDVNYFGAPTDIDGNGHVAILFTRAVNELTPANSGAFVGGFFNPRDLFPRTQSSSFAVCPTSNEGEMFYMMVPDPSGTVNGNMFRRGFVDTLTTGVLAHEFQHLINAGRRMYVNTAATDFEETWLNEGLSHEAEELLYFSESALGPRARLTANSILDTWAHYGPWVSDDASNFVNLYLYLRDPANHSPIDVDDALETRGATWALLRFAVDKAANYDFGIWQRFTNSTTTGLGTLSSALQRDPKLVLKDFAVANMMGSHPSWNFEDVYTRVFVGIGRYPLQYGFLQEGAAVPVAARGGSASYYKFSVPPGVQGLLRFGSSGAPPDGNLKFVLTGTVISN